jgi:DNA-binding NarL/FixJ family response regulator
MNPITVALADDHKLVREGVANLLTLKGHAVVFQCGDGSSVVTYALMHHPDLVLMDLHMPEMNGWEATEALNRAGYSGKVLVLSMLDDEGAVIRAIRSGAAGFILKDASPDELDLAIREVHQKGFFHSDFISSKLVSSFTGNGEGENLFGEREREFLGLVCTELTYKEIAAHMNVSPRTIDGYRDVLFDKVNAKSRVGLVLYAIKKGLVRA